MKTHQIFLYVILSTLLGLGMLSGCKPNERVANRGVDLRFSADTVYLDTVFSTIGSSTRSVRIINPSDEAILIDHVSLGRGEQSPFRFNIDGREGPEVHDLILPAGDSIWVFVEVTAPAGGAEMLHTDSLVMVNKGRVQSIDLVSLAWDAHFHFPTHTLILPQPAPYADLRLPYSILPQQATWGNDKPHVVYGYVVVDSGASLDVLAGARIHFHAQSGMWVASGGAVHFDGAEAGSYAQPIVLEGDRLEPFYDDIAGQWGGLLGGIFVQRGASLTMNNTWMKNGTVGIRCDSVPEGYPANVVIRNSLFTDFSRATLYSGFGHLRMENSVIAHAGLYALYALGGRVSADHCTFHNQFPAARSTPSVGLFNRYDDGTGTFRYRALNQAHFGNCIITGNQESEVGLGYDAQTPFDYFFEGCLLKLKTNPVPATYDVQDVDFFSQCLFHGAPQFVLPESRNFALDSTSAALHLGVPGPAARVPFDALGLLRPATPDAGALERL